MKELTSYNRVAGYLNKVFDLLQATYDEYVKNKVIQEFPNGNKKWMHANLDANNDKIARDIAAGVQHLLQTRQDLNKPSLLDSILLHTKQLFNYMSMVLNWTLENTITFCKHAKPQKIM